MDTFQLPHEEALLAGGLLKIWRKQIMTPGRFALSNGNAEHKASE
jgi:hypothetical protein